MLVLKVLLKLKWSWVHRLHFLILSILEYMRLLLRKLTTQCVKPAQVELKDFSLSPSLLAVISLFQIPHLYAIIRLSVLCSFCCCFYFVAADRERSFWINSKSHLSVCGIKILYKMVRTEKIGAVSVSHEGIEKVWELPGKSLQCLLSKLQVSVFSIQNHTFQMINYPFTYKICLIPKGIKEEESYCQEKQQRWPKLHWGFSNVTLYIHWLFCLFHIRHLVNDACFCPSVESSRTPFCNCWNKYLHLTGLQYTPWICPVLNLLVACFCSLLFTNFCSNLLIPWGFFCSPQNLPFLMPNFYFIYKGLVKNLHRPSIIWGTSLADGRVCPNLNCSAWLAELYTKWNY